MTEINPPTRRRTTPVIAPPARTRSVTVSPPARRRAPADPEMWYIPKGVRPLGPLQLTHNDATRYHGAKPDPRFRPLLIVIRDEHRKACPDYVRNRFREAQKLTADDCADLWLPKAGNIYICEFILREHLGYKMLNDDVYHALLERLLSGWDEKRPNEMIPDVHRSMFTRTDDGDLTVGVAKATGPYHAEMCLLIERYFKDDLLPLQRGASN